VSQKGYKFWAFGLELAQPFFNTVFLLSRTGKKVSHTWPHGMCYSHLGNGVHNWAISITQRGFITGYSKVNPIGPWGKILVMAMGFVEWIFFSWPIYT
jgi:hypothetical protein